MRDDRACSRIIPAYAGSTPDRPPIVETGEDHPRIRGEHWGHGGPGRGPRGSSPHTRGARRRSDTPRRPRRIIPAYAGSTTLPDRGEARQSDHPRIRGEHQIHLNSTGDIRGSSPHTRGAPSSEAPTVGPLRIIPAYAGSTGARRRSSSGTWDHPRIRGEHHTSSQNWISRAGSSPHTRGAH